MSSINILSREISELIAAGEVIERPASVIKELVENSIDSGAGHITVEIKNGGLSYMRVTDDGGGMSFDDVPKAFLRHATSKILTKDDLDNICTLGFRGEALASVSAVSKVETMTKQKNETYGTLYKIEGCEEVLHEKSGCPDGTTIIIRDLFYNVPARRKFMKKDVTEANAVSQIIQKITLSHPEISFKFIRDNRIEFNSSGDGELFSAVYAVYGRDFARDMMPVEYEANNIHITGYAVKPLYSKNNRSFQNFFVNGRHIRSKICSVALESAYENMVMTGKFPACVIMIDISPSVIDVNIHPSKAEVRFTNEKEVSDAIFYAIKKAMVNDGLIYEFELKPTVKQTEVTVQEKEEIEQQQEFIFTPVDKIEETEKKLSEKNVIVPDVPDEFFETADIEVCSAYNEPEKKADNTIQIPQKTEKKVSEPLGNFSYINSKSFETAESSENKTVSETENNKKSVWTEKQKIRVIGEAFGLYVIAETDDNKIVMIDKHAAHERIIFERLKSRNCRQYTQMLMNEIKVLLTAEEFSAMEENTELLADLGFLFDFSERPCISAKAVPTFVIELDIEAVIAEIADNLRLYRHNPQSHMLDDMLHTVACKSAIKANDSNSMSELQSLAEQVYYDEKIRHCPHGRPVMFTMTKSNIARQFGRT
ncbi:MAG: DNA mismatch repair endonuclease MutL [Ruminococcus sp.]|nr:DNA mismatch repair endonuclease MutL [Ruminococcus sp.]MDE6848790.1 DNA mismatch repair endonuclease MutL [Ruminococcus sp.]